MDSSGMPWNRLMRTTVQWEQSQIPQRPASLHSCSCQIRTTSNAPVPQCTLVISSSTDPQIIMGSKLKIHAKPGTCKLINKHALQVIFQVKKTPNGHCKKNESDKVFCGISFLLRLMYLLVFYLVVTMRILILLDTLSL